MSYPNSVNLTNDINAQVATNDLVCETLQCSVKLFAPTVEVETVEVQTGGNIDLDNGSINIIGSGNYYLNGVPITAGAIPDPLNVNNLNVGNVSALYGNVVFNSNVIIPNNKVSANLIESPFIGVGEIQGLEAHFLNHVSGGEVVGDNKIITANIESKPDENLKITIIKTSPPSIINYEFNSLEFNAGQVNCGTITNLSSLNGPIGSDILVYSNIDMSGPKSIKNATLENIQNITMGAGTTLYADFIQNVGGGQINIVGSDVSLNGGGLLDTVSLTNSLGNITINPVNGQTKIESNIDLTNNNILNSKSIELNNGAFKTVLQSGASNKTITLPANNPTFLRTFISTSVLSPDILTYSDANFGFFSQTANGPVVINTAVETSVIGAGVGSLSVPGASVPGGLFYVGSSFCATGSGQISLNNAQTLTLRLVETVSATTLATIVLTGPPGSITPAQNFKLTSNFTWRSVGVSGELWTNFSITLANGTTFLGDVQNSLASGVNTTLNQTLALTAQFSVASITNVFQLQSFTLSKCY